MGCNVKMTKSMLDKISSFWILITVNLIIGVLALLILLSLIGWEARHSGRTSYVHIEGNTTEESCKESAHIQLSIEQARLLKKDISDLDRYCKSKSLITAEWSKARTYWDYHYYSHKELNTPELKFNDENQFNSRAVPCSDNVRSQNARDVFWLFGGSTMQNLETSDENTIANTFCKRYPIKEAIVINFGVGSFYSEMETAKLLNLYKINIRAQYGLPTAAIFYNGYNDSHRLMSGASWAGLPSGVSNRLSSAYSTTDSFRKASYWFVRALNEKFMNYAGGKKNFVNDTLIRGLMALEVSEPSVNSVIAKTTDWREESDGMLLTSRAYIHDQRVLSSICKAIGIKCFTVLQPVLSLRDRPVGKIEIQNYQRQERDGINQITRRFYSEVKAALLPLQDENYFLIDLSGLPNERRYVDLPFFYDFGHTGYYTGEIIGERLGKEVFNIIYLN